MVKRILPFLVLSLSFLGLFYSLVQAEEFPYFIQNFSVDKGPLALAVDEEKNMIFVGNNDGADSTTAGSMGGGNGNLAIINGSSGSVQLLKDNRVTHPLGAAFNPKTRKLYIGNNDNNEQGGLVTVMNVDTLSYSKFRVGAVPRSVAINTKTNRVYITSNDETPWKSISVVDGNTDQEMTRIQSPGIPAYVAVDEELNRFYVTNWHEGKDEDQLVMAFDGSSNKLIWSTLITAPQSRHRTKGTTPYAIAVNNKNHNLYLTANSGVGENGLSGFIYILDQNGQVKDFVQAGERASGIVYNPVSGRIFVSVIIKSGQSYSLFVYKEESGKLVKEKEIPVPGLTDSGLAVNSKTGQVFVGVLGDARLISVIQDQPGSATTPTISSPSGRRCASNGDLNSDGQVDRGDFEDWIEAFLGNSQTVICGGKMEVGLVDFNLWRGGCLEDSTCRSSLSGQQ